MNETTTISAMPDASACSLGELVRSFDLSILDPLSPVRIAVERLNRTHVSYAHSSSPVPTEGLEFRPLVSELFERDGGDSMPIKDALTGAPGQTSWASESGLEL